MHNYRPIVENIFNRWSALQVAVERGCGGRESHKKAIYLMDYMYEYCTANADEISQMEIEEKLTETMNQEFETICEDGSITEIAAELWKFLKLCQEKKLVEIKAELCKKPKMWLTKSSQQTIADSSDDSELECIYLESDDSESDYIESDNSESDERSDDEEMAMNAEVHQDNGAETKKDVIKDNS